jgi:glycerophosphoryl diester phosphodiesterase
MPSNRARPHLLAIAHRGAHRDHPENSLPAILRAIELGAQGIEIDVNATADGVLVVHHDPDLAGGGEIAVMSAEEISRRELAPGIGIPLLDEVLDAVAGKAILFIETKVAGVEFPLLRAIRRSNAESAVHSFHHQTIRNLKITMPALRAGILTEGSAPAALLALKDSGADDLWHKTKDIDDALVSECHRLGKQVIAWTANRESECRRLESLGVDGICTDDLSLLKAVAR